MVGAQSFSISQCTIHTAMSSKCGDIPEVQNLGGDLE